MVFGKECNKIHKKHPADDIVPANTNPGRNTRTDPQSRGERNTVFHLLLPLFNKKKNYCHKKNEKSDQTVGKECNKIHKKHPADDIVPANTNPGRNTRTDPQSRSGRNTVFHLLLLFFDKKKNYCHDKK